MGMDKTNSEDLFMDPLVTDMVEDRWIYVGKSPENGGEYGEGVFAKTVIPANTVFSYFGGIKMKIDIFNKTKPVDPSFWAFIDETKKEVIYLPEEYGKDTSKYRATLGHKINNHLRLFNCV